MPMVPASGEDDPLIYRKRHVPNPITAEEIAPNLLAVLVNNPHKKGPKNTEPIAPQDIDNMATIVSGLKYANITERRMKKTLAYLISMVSRSSDTSFAINPAYKSFITAELEISTKAAKVDMDADKISSNMITDKNSGITCANNSGIKASKIGLPFSNALGVVCGDKNNRVVAPVKYATPQIRAANRVEAIIPISIAFLSLIA